MKSILRTIMGLRDNAAGSAAGASPVPQTGLIIAPPGPRDWIGRESGMLSGAVLPGGDWTPFVPTRERQYATLGFDSMSCATFSALSSIETLFEATRGSVPEECMEYLRRFGFMDAEGKMNASDNFTAVMSGTTAEGNTLAAVLESVRKDGIVPEKDYPFCSESFEAFHDRKRITPYMRARARKFLEYFSLQYSWAHFSSGNGNSKDDIEAMRSALRQSPLHAGIGIPASHAVEIIRHSGGTKAAFDSYDPFVIETADQEPPIHFSIMIALVPKRNAPRFPAPANRFASQMKAGMTSPEVEALQKILSYFGFMNVATGYFGPLTRAAVIEFQKFHGLDPVGEVGPKTRAILNSMFQSADPAVATSAQRLYAAALACLNTDVTPMDVVSDEVACAETVNAVHKRAFGKEIGGGPSTHQMYRALLSHPDFFKAASPEPGDVVISPTGYGSGQLPNGHVGIVGTGGAIMSNSSSSGRFSENFTMESWRARYVGRGGFPMAFFRRKHD